MAIQLNQPLKPNLERLTSYLSQVNDRNWYTNFGPCHEELTQRLEAYLGVENLLLVSNGTLALQVACKALNVTSALTTPFSFVATTSALLWQGIDTAFSDIDVNTFNLCPIALDKAFEEDNHYDAIVATHVYGNPCDVERIQLIAHKYNKKVIYDAAHSFAVNIGGQSVLNFGDASTLSFHATKVFHTVEGGAIVFKDRKVYEKAKQLINFGIKSDGTLGEPGINAKLNEYQCAVGLTLLDDIESSINHRKQLFMCYRNELEGVVDMPLWHGEASLNGAYMPIYISDSAKQEAILMALRNREIQFRRYFTPSLDVAFNKQKSFGCIRSQLIADGIVCLPLHNSMTIEDVLQVSDVIKEAL